MNTTHSDSEKSIGTIISELTSEINTLFRQEIGLVKTEISEKVGQAKNGVGMLVVGALIVYAGFMVLLGAAVAGLALVMDLWLAALLVAALVVIIGGSMLASGNSKLKAGNLVPEKSMDQVKHDKDLAKKHATTSNETRQPSA